MKCDDSFHLFICKSNELIFQLDSNVLNQSALLQRIDLGMALLLDVNQRTYLDGLTSLMFGATRSSARGEGRLLKPVEVAPPFLLVRAGIRKGFM